MIVTEFPINANLAPLYNRGCVATITFKVNILGYGRKAAFHNVTRLGAYDQCVDPPGFMVMADDVNGQIFDLKDIESIEIEKETEYHNASNWVDRNL